MILRLLLGSTVAALAACGPASSEDPPADDPKDELGGVKSSGTFFDETAKLVSGFLHRRVIGGVEYVELLAVSEPQACTRLTSNLVAVAAAYANNDPGEGQIAALADADNDSFPAGTATARLTFPDPHEATGEVALGTSTQFEICVKNVNAELQFDPFGAPFLYTDVTCSAPSSAGVAAIQTLSSSHLDVDITVTVADDEGASGDVDVSADVLRCTQYEDAL